MELREILEQLLTPLTVGAELGGFVVEELTVAHGMRVVVARDDVRVFLDVDAADPAYPAAVRTSRLAVSYRAADPARPLAASVGRALAASLASHLALREDTVLDRVEAHARAMTQRVEGGARLREVRVTQALEPAGRAHARFETVSPYVGCLVGCRFCYAQERLHRGRALLGLAAAPWGSWLDARVNIVEVLREELASARAPLPIKLCPVVSDPYVALETRLRLTRGVLEALADDGRREVFVLTRSALVREDLPLLARARAHLGFSLPTLDEAVRVALEPRGAPIAERLRILQEARAMGVRTFAMVQPVLERDVARFADTLAPVIDGAEVDVLRGTYGARDAFETPALAALATEAQQRELAQALREALRARGVNVWGAELPRESLPRPIADDAHVTLRVDAPERPSGRKPSAASPGERYAEALLSPLAQHPVASILRGAVASGALPHALIEPSFTTEDPSALRLGVNAASARQARDRAALTTSLLTALATPTPLHEAALRLLADPRDEVFVGLALEQGRLRSKVYLRAEAPRLHALGLAQALSLSLPGDVLRQAGVRTLAVDVGEGAVVGGRWYEPLPLDDARVAALVMAAGGPPLRHALRARRLRVGGDTGAALEEIVHVAIDPRAGLAPALQLAREMPASIKALDALVSLTTRVLSRGSAGSGPSGRATLYLAPR